MVSRLSRALGKVQTRSSTNPDWLLTWVGTAPALEWALASAAALQLHFSFACLFSASAFRHQPVHVTKPSLCSTEGGEEPSRNSGSAPLCQGNKPCGKALEMQRHGWVSRGSNSVLHPSAQGALYLYAFICLGFTWVMSSTHEQGHCQLPSLLYSNSCPYLSFCSLNANVRVTQGSEHERTWCLWLGGFTIKGLGYSCLSQHSSE